MEIALIIVGVSLVLLFINYYFFVKPMEQYKKLREIKKNKLLISINEMLNELELFTEYKELVGEISDSLLQEYIKDLDYDDKDHIRIVLAHLFLSTAAREAKTDKEYRLKNEILTTILKPSITNHDQQFKHLKVIESIATHYSSSRKRDEYLHALAKYIYSRKRKGSKIPHIKLNEYSEIMGLLSQRQYEFYEMLYDQNDFFIDD